MCILGARLHKDIMAINGAMAVQFDTWKSMYVNLLDHGYIHNMDITGLPMDRDGGHGTASGQFSGKGHGKGDYEVMVPTDPKAANGPMHLETGWVPGWKIWAGDLPRCIHCKGGGHRLPGHCCEQQQDHEWHGLLCHHLQ
jgi:hypothetical protein